MNPYFHPLPKPDGGEWPALVERCPECRPEGVYHKHSGVIGDYFTVGDFASNDSCGCCEQLGTTLSLECGALLTRERAIAFLQSWLRNKIQIGGSKKVPRPDGAFFAIVDALNVGAPDETYARLCHEILDAREKA